MSKCGENLTLSFFQRRGSVESFSMKFHSKSRFLMNLYFGLILCYTCPLLVFHNCLQSLNSSKRKCGGDVTLMSWQWGREHRLVISCWRAASCFCLSSSTASLFSALSTVTSCCCSRKRCVTSSFSANTFISWENLPITHWDVCCNEN